MLFYISPNDNYRKKLNPKERDISDRVINKFLNFNIKKLVDYMHKEKEYIETDINDVINFSYAK